MQTISILTSRFALAASLTLLPVAMIGQTSSMSAASSNGAGISASDKKFGQRMVDDHTKAGDQLKEVASSKGISVPDKLSAKDEATKMRLSKLSGEQFDKAYMSDMVKDHTQDVADFRRESKSGMDPDVKNFASQTLPTLEDHLRKAKEIAPTTSASNKMGDQ